jgi:hypothetical protein
MGAIVATSVIGVASYKLFGAKSAPSVTTSPTTRSTISLLGPAYPTGNRVVRIRPLSEGSQWQLSGYTATDVLNWITDLRPTTLQRFCTGSQDPSAIVPTSDNSKLTVLQFLQNCLDSLQRVDNTSIFHRLSADELSTGTFYQSAQSLWNLNQQLDPPQTLISIDNLNSSTPSSTVSQISKGLFEIGWQGIALGACGDAPITPGEATFALICVNTSTWQVNTNAIQSLEKKGISNTTAFEAQLDFPSEIQQFVSQGPDSMASILESLARGQSRNGYTFTYDIAQGGYDAHSFITTKGGDYWNAGDSIYTVCKNLLNEFNP